MRVNFSTRPVPLPAGVRLLAVSGPTADGGAPDGTVWCAREQPPRLPEEDASPVGP
ncbi:hypothetical protein ABTY96_42945 [Streptomyces sp. NPDC096057]|uniref:hypothetical protein n=1 Tax=Streptomyces sp. NPDC096057 TaxID=3155543 RepID=UPI003319A57D